MAPLTLLSPPSASGNIQPFLLLVLGRQSCLYNSVLKLRSDNGSWWKKRGPVHIELENTDRRLVRSEGRQTSCAGSALM